MIHAGASKKDITCFIKGVGLFGYGDTKHVARGIETRLYARAVIFKEPVTGNKSAYVCAEILSITTAVRKGVIQKMKEEHAHLGFSPESIMLAATHTHSAPGGFSHYALYNFTVPGFVQKVYDTLVNGIVEAIVEADANARPAKLSFTSGEFTPDIKVAFNRSLTAYNNNTGVEQLSDTDRHLAVNRTMYLLRVDDEQNRSIASINWFGVHTTSVGPDRYKICSDNKGYAAAYMENYLIGQTQSGTQLSFAIFAQDGCGDVSPNFRWDQKRNRMQGESEDDYENAKFNGHLQFEKAKELHLLAGEEGNRYSVFNTEQRTSNIDYALSYADFSNLNCLTEFTNGIPNRRTGPPCLGVSFFTGTTDGAGLSHKLGKIVRIYTTIFKFFETTKANFFVNANTRDEIKEKYTTQGVKHIMMETKARKVFGEMNVGKLIIPSWSDRAIYNLKKHYRSGGLNDKPWAPNVLPVQLLIIGKLAIASIPGEITTVAAKHLRRTIAESLAGRGVEHVVCSCYSNAYSGYITTYEEYQTQCYEGGHTMYGEWTLAAYQTQYKKLCGELLKKHSDRKIDNNVQPVEFTENDLKKRMFEEA